MPLAFNILFAIVSFISLVIIGGHLLVVYMNWYDWNGGKCRKCGGDWKARITDTEGMACLFRCKKCKNVLIQRRRASPQQ